MKQLMTALFMCAMISVLGQNIPVQDQLEILSHDIEALNLTPQKDLKLLRKLKNEYSELTTGQIRNQAVLDMNLSKSAIKENVSLMNLDSSYTQSYVEATDTFSDSLKTIYKYEDDQFLQIQEFYTYEENEWVISEREEYVFYEDGLSFSFSYFERNVSGNFVGTNKYTYLYEDSLEVFNSWEKWDLESEDWYVVSKTELSYQNGNLVEEVTWEWNMLLNGLVKSDRNSQVYDEDNNLVIRTVELWDLNTETWVNAQKLEFEYENGLEHIFVLSRWNSNLNQYDFDTKRELEFNSNSDVIKATYYYADNNSWVFNYSNIMEYEYDANGLIIENITKVSSDNITLENYSKRVYGYDEGGNQISLTTYYWGEEGWYFRLSYAYTFDNEGRRTGYESYSGFSSGEIFGSLKYTIEYADDLRTTTYYKWDYNNDLFIEDYKWKYEYDNNQIVSAEYFEKVEDEFTLKARKLNYRSAYFEQFEEIPFISINAGGSVTFSLDDYFKLSGTRKVVYTLTSLEGIVELDLDEDLVTISSSEETLGLDTVKLSVLINGQYEGASIYFGVEVLKVLSEELSIVRVYPNPTSDFISIRNGNISSKTRYNLIDFNGQQIKHGIVSTKISLANLPKGTYFLILEDGSNRETYKVIKN